MPRVAVPEPMPSGVIRFLLLDKAGPAAEY